ncbi:TPA: hypothetical protein N0F65_006190, partial [Lagenidium giganteum]
GSTFKARRARAPLCTSLTSPAGTSLRLSASLDASRSNSTLSMRVTRLTHCSYVTAAAMELKSSQFSPRSWKWIR